MKKICVSMVVVLLAMASPLFADTITVSNTLTFGSGGATSSGDGIGTLVSYRWERVNKIITSDYVSWSQSFVFDSLPENETVTGILTLYLRDDVVYDDSITSIDGYEYALGYANSGQLALDEVNTGTYTYNVVLNNGTLDVFLTALLGDFYIDKAVLDVTYATAAAATTTDAAPVPEPTSLLLLGVGMLSAGLFTRKRNKQG